MSNLVTWKWPVPGVSSITSRYGRRGKEMHHGLDIGAGYGKPVVATRSGKVSDTYVGCPHNYGKDNHKDPAGCGEGYGNRVYIDHGDGYSSRYAHLTSVSVYEGDTVAAGQVIGTVGSTGNSSGNHLHFEVRKDGKSLNPEKFISYSSTGDSVVNMDGVEFREVNSEGIDSSSPTYYPPVEAGGTTVGQRVSGLSTQPLHAFINIWLGDKLLATDPARPNVIQSLRITKLEGSGDEAEFSLFDDNWEEIEAALSANWDNVRIQYGYYGTGLKSKTIKFLLQSYSINFETTGTLIAVRAIGETVSDNLVPRNLALETRNPTEAVKSICKELGYKIADENFDSSADISSDNPFNMIEQFPITYIQNVIIPQASQENEELFKFFIDEEGYAHFKKYSYSSTNTDTLRTYIFQKGYDSTVIDFSVDIKGVFGGSGTFGIATGYRASVFSNDNKKLESTEATKSSVVTEAPGDVTHTKTGQSNVVVDTAGYSPSQSKSILYYNMKAHLYEAYSATLTIIGDPTIDFVNERYIRVINMTDRGNLHHTSGVYWITGVSHDISGGKMTTSLDLSRAASAGDIDGVEIINPKYYIK